MFLLITDSQYHLFSSPVTSLPFPSQQVPAFKSSPSSQHQQCLVSVYLMFFTPISLDQISVPSASNSDGFLPMCMGYRAKKREQEICLTHPDTSVLMSSRAQQMKRTVLPVYGMVKYGWIFKQKAKWTTLTKTAKPFEEKKPPRLWQTPSIRKLSLPG